MNHHVIRSAVALYRGGTFTLEQAARHAGVSSARMETALRRHGVALRTETIAPTAGDRPDRTVEDLSARSVNAD